MRFILAGDFETFWDQRDGYSLGKMTTEEYIRDPRFEAQCFCGILIESKTAKQANIAIPHDQMEAVLHALPWDQCAFLAHNTRFDAGILGLRYGIQPAGLLDTFSMAAYLFPAARRGERSLRGLAEFYGAGSKGTAALDLAGSRWSDMSQAQRIALMNYCAQDVELLWQIFKHMRPEFTNSQLAYIDLLLRCFTRPLLEGDQERLQAYITAVERQRADILQRLNLDERVQEYRDIVAKANPTLNPNSDEFMLLMVAKYLNAARGDNLAHELTEIGARVPYKLNTKGQAIYAFAKTDEGMQELLESDDPNVATLAEAKLNLASSGPVSKAKNYLAMAKRGPMCIPLNYYGSHTSRLTSGESLNFLAMQRGSEVRKSLVAPKGYRVVAGDAAQIQARLAMWFAKCEYFLDLFRANDRGELDVYCTFGSDHVYGRTITKADKAERQVSKRAVLGLIFRMGVDRFREACLADGRTMGIPIPDDEAIYRQAHRAFRQVAPELLDVWTHLELLLKNVLAGIQQKDKFHGVIESTERGFRMPNYMYLPFRDLELRDDGQFRFQSKPNRWTHLHGGPALNNVIQFFEQIHMQYWALTMHVNGFPVVLLPHDELVVLAKEGAADACVTLMRDVMRTPMPWAEGLPLNAEVGHSHSYGLVEKV